MSRRHDSRTGIARHNALFAACLVASLMLAFVLWSWAWPMQKQRACWLGEWPYEGGCSTLPTGKDMDNRASVYTQYLTHNIGDSRAWVWLTTALYRDGNPQAGALLPETLQLAPTHIYTLALQAEAQMGAGNWKAAARSLIALLAQGQARQALPTLLALMTNKASQADVLGLLDKDAVWLDGVLATLGRDTPVRSVQPFITAGNTLGILKPRTVLGLIDRMNQQGEWQNAYTLWVALHRQVSIGLYNGAFDQPMTGRGFDWNWAAQKSGRQGFVLDQISAAPRPGTMLELHLTGHAAVPTPLLWQYLVLPGRDYRLSGQYKVNRLRTDDGLIWTMRCAAGGDPFAQTRTIMQGQSGWQKFHVDVQIPPECATAVKLQLQASSPGEARAGMTGTIYFDQMHLEPMQGPDS